MAKKPKRRGRPPESKNKKAVVGRRGRPPGSTNITKGVRAPTGVVKSFAKMEVAQLRGLIDDLEGLLAQRVREQRSILEGHLAELQGYVSEKAAGVVRSVMRVPRADGAHRAKPAPKYQSKKDKGLKWSGRGMLPVWMREEIKGTKLAKEDFLIR